MFDKVDTARLKRALQDIEAALPLLRVNRNKCYCCNATRYDNQDEFQAAEELGAAALRKWIPKIEALRRGEVVER